MCGLLEHSNMNHLRIDFRHKPIAVKAYLGLMMTLPYGRVAGLLLQRIPIRNNQNKIVEVSEQSEA